VPDQVSACRSAKIVLESESMKEKTPERKTAVVDKNAKAGGPSREQQ
jgi:hypothetical protein